LSTDAARPAPGGIFFAIQAPAAIAKQGGFGYNSKV
jgi:hypothetical protein